jgi:hypothetical protein
VQRGGRKIREAQYASTEERFAGVNINIFARHITRSGVKWLAFQQEPEEMLWGGRADGALIAHPHSPEQEIKGFARAELGGGTAIAGVLDPFRGRLESMSCGSWRARRRERASFSSRRGGTRTPDTDQADAFFVDWGVSYDGRAARDVQRRGSSTSRGDGRILADGAVCRRRSRPAAVR